MAMVGVGAVLGGETVVGGEAVDELTVLIKKNIKLCYNLSSSTLA